MIMRNCVGLSRLLDSLQGPIRVIVTQCDGPTYKQMSTSSHIHVRPLEIADFPFVRALASKQPDFTVPPLYVLWLIVRIKGAICLVAEHSSSGPIAYLLAVPIEGQGNSIFIWQVAALEGRQRNKATSAILTEFRKTVLDLAFDSVQFSSVPNSSAYRLIRRYAWKLASIVPEKLHALPAVVSDRETEFRLSVSNIRSS